MFQESRRLFMINSLIIGYGVIGSQLDRELKKLGSDAYDKYKNIDTRRNIVYDVAFICVNTPKTKTELNDISEVRNALLENEADLFIIKSAILPTVSEQLTKETGKQIVISPEYYGVTQHSSNYDFDFTILGGEIENTSKAQQILQTVYDARHRFYHVPFREAELVKYMENSWLAYKVSFMHQFKDIADRYDVNYDRLRELFILDPRVHPSNTFVYNDHEWWESHCYDKDIPAIAEANDAQLLLDLIKFNEKRKPKK